MGIGFCVATQTLVAALCLSLTQSLQLGLLLKQEEEEEEEEQQRMESGVEWIKELSDVPMGKLPPHLELQRTRVECKADAPIHVFLFHSFSFFSLQYKFFTMLV